MTVFIISVVSQKEFYGEISLNHGHSSEDHKIAWSTFFLGCLVRAKLAKSRIVKSLVRGLRGAANSDGIHRAQESLRSPQFCENVFDFEPDLPTWLQVTGTEACNVGVLPRGWPFAESRQPLLKMFLIPEVSREVSV